MAQRQRVPDGSATPQVIKYSLDRWDALRRNWPMCLTARPQLGDAIRPITPEKRASSALVVCRRQLRAASAITLLHAALLKGLNVHVYMKDIHNRLPTPVASRVTELLAYRWTSA